MADSTAPDPRVFEMLRRFIDAVDTALADENVDPATIRRVMNRLLVGHSEGLDAAWKPDVQEDRRRRLPGWPPQCGMTTSLIPEDGLLNEEVRVAVDLGATPGAAGLPDTEKSQVFLDKLNVGGWIGR